VWLADVNGEEVNMNLQAFLGLADDTSLVGMFTLGFEYR